MRLESPDGTLHVLITNLIDSTLYKSSALIQLYSRRWRIDEQYRDEKLTLRLKLFIVNPSMALNRELL